MTDDFNIDEFYKYNVIPQHGSHGNLVKRFIKNHTEHHKADAIKSHISVIYQTVNTLKRSILVTLKHLSNYIHYLKIRIIFLQQRILLGHFVYFFKSLQC